LNGALEILAGLDLMPGSTFTIINSTGAGPVSGAFTGRPNNSTFAASGYNWRINYNGGTGNDVVLTLVTTALENWRYANFGTLQNTGNAADLADGDGDGLSNFLEYSLGGNPNIASGNPLPKVSTIGGRLALTFTRTVANTDITMTVQGTDNLGGAWVDLASSVSGASTAPLLGGVSVTETGSGATRTVEVRDLYLTSDPAHPHRYLHLRVTKP
jgi:hypothetical protein